MKYVMGLLTNKGDSPRLEELNKARKFGSEDDIAAIANDASKEPWIRERARNLLDCLELPAEKLQAIVDSEESTPYEFLDALIVQFRREHNPDSD